MKTEKRLTKVQMVKNHLVQGFPITQRGAIDMFHAYRLAAIIFVLKNEHGMNITTTMVNGYGEDSEVRFAKYQIVKEEEPSI